jgi:HSP20 family protein
MAEDRPQPLQPFFAVQDEVRRLFQELVHQPWGGPRPSTVRTWQPRCDLAETEATLIVEVELPGVAREDVQVEVEGDILRISGERRTTVERQGRHYLHTEQSYGSFTRELRLPRIVDRDAIQAHFVAGVLTITLPKKAAQ